MDDLEMQFKATLDENPLDTATHYAYADWLQEQGRDEEASLHRKWTPGAHRAAVEYMKNVIQKVIVCDYDDSETYYDNYQELLNDATRYLESGTRKCLPFDCYDMDINSSYGMETFWKHYEILTGRPVHLEGSDTGFFFRCAC